MATRNITLSLPDDLVRRVKVYAAQRDTSVSSLVADLLWQRVSDEDDYDSSWAAEERQMAQGIDMSVGEITWSREETHAR